MSTHNIHFHGEIRKIYIMSPNPWGRGHIDFGADPIDFGIGVGVSVTLSCLHNIL